MRKPNKSSKRGNRRAVTDRSATTDVVSQLECAVRYPQATLIGALIGGVVPWFARTLAHEEIPAAWAAGNHALALVMASVVLGCACFSAPTVYKFSRAAFGDSRKALGFVLAIEGVMLVSHGVTSAVALAVLIAINALANGSVIALSRAATCRQREADARGAATRARSRAEAAAARRSVPVATPISAPHRRSHAAPGCGVVPVAAPVQWFPALADAIDIDTAAEQGLLLS
jgi:hypothetical protein